MALRFWMCVQEKSNRNWRFKRCKDLHFLAQTECATFCGLMCSTRMSSIQIFPTKPDGKLSPHTADSAPLLVLQKDRPSLVPQKAVGDVARFPIALGELYLLCSNMSSEMFLFCANIFRRGRAHPRTLSAHSLSATICLPISSRVFASVKTPSASNRVCAAPIMISG
jgi:hypothetical protein